MPHNLNIYSTDGRETSYGIYVNGTKQATVNLTWSIATNCTNGTYSGDSVINRGSGTASVTIAANTGYELPSTVTVSGATSSYNSTTGVISLSNPTGNVSITAVCTQVLPTLITPDIDLDGDDLLIYSNDEHDESYDIYVDGVYETTVQKVSGYEVGFSVQMWDQGYDYCNIYINGNDNTSYNTSNVPTTGITSIKFVSNCGIWNSDDPSERYSTEVWYNLTSNIYFVISGND